MKSDNIFNLLSAYRAVIGCISYRANHDAKHAASMGL